MKLIHLIEVLGIVMTKMSLSGDEKYWQSTIWCLISATQTLGKADCRYNSLDSTYFWLFTTMDHFGAILLSLTFVQGIAQVMLLK